MLNYTVTHERDLIFKSHLFLKTRRMIFCIWRKKVSAAGKSRKPLSYTTGGVVENEMVSRIFCS